MERINAGETMNMLRDSKRPPHFLAMDQSGNKPGELNGTHFKQMKQFGVPIRDVEDLETKSRQVRVMLATTPGLGQYFGGAIVHNDFFALTAPDGKPLQKVLEEQGVIVIGKTLGLAEDGLATGLDEIDRDMRRLVSIGVPMVKTRTTARFGLPTGLIAVAQMVRVHAAAAHNGQIVAVLEPEVLRDNIGTLPQNEEVMTRLLGGILDQIRREGLAEYPFVLKTSFPTPGSQSKERIEPQACAESFKRICKIAGIPDELFIVFLSGGHSPETSRELLQAMAKVRSNVGSSFSRANLERPYRETFRAGGNGHQAVALEGLKNRLAMEGRYRPIFEKAHP